MSTIDKEKSQDIIEQYKELNEKIEFVLEKISARKNKKDKK